MVVALAMDENEAYTNRPHQLQHHSYVAGSASSGVSSNSQSNSFPLTNSVFAPRKEWQSARRISQSHHPNVSVDTSHFSRAASGTGADSVGGSGPTKSQNFDGREHHASSGNESSGGSLKFQEVISMLVYCYLEYGGTVRSEEFRNLVEVFLCPIFEPLLISNSRSGVASGVASASALPSSSSMSSTTCIATCSSSTSSAASGPSSNGGSSSSGPSTSGSSIINGGCKECSSGIGCSRFLQGDTLSCPSCLGILAEPVTVTCGHTFCRKCLQKEIAGQKCYRCSHLFTVEDLTQCKTNVLVGSLVEKWWSKEVTAKALRNEGNCLFQQKQIDEALAKYNEALNLYPEDHLCLGNRSQALLTAGKSEEALQDADAATRCCPSWAKGHFRKSAALISLGRYEEAFLSLTLCMYLIKVESCTLVLRRVGPNTSSSQAPVDVPTPSSGSSSLRVPIAGHQHENVARTQVINEMIKILQKMILQSTNAAVGSILKRHNTGEQVQFTPYPNGRIVCRYHERRRLSRNRSKNWNDSECTSSGDESDSQARPYHLPTTAESRKTCCNFQHLPAFVSSYHGHDSHKSHNSIPSSSIVDHLRQRINRLLSRATQDLKSFEFRLLAHHQQRSTSVRQTDLSLVSSNDLECSLCYRLLFQPVSTCCGHTFCRSCLERCLDHNPSCPLCKTSLQNYLASRDHAVTEFLEVGLRHFLPKESDERLSQHLEELNSTAVPQEGKSSTDVDIPIFVCTMAFPTIPCPLHVFEPRYRLMIRRCMENGSNRFGMCCYLADGEYNYGDIGTLLEIKNIQYFADGRSVVDTVGCRRFKVVSKNLVDGYNAAKIELLNDQPVEEDEIPVVKALHDKVFNEASEWLQSIGQVRRQRILSHFGSMPSPEENWLDSPDGPSWIWWLLAILPLDSKAQLAILSMCSLRKRLDCILKVLTFVKNRMSAIGE